MCRRPINHIALTFWLDMALVCSFASSIRRVSPRWYEGSLHLTIVTYFVLCFSFYKINFTSVMFPLLTKRRKSKKASCWGFILNIYELIIKTLDLYLFLLIIIDVILIHVPSNWSSCGFHSDRGVAYDKND